MLSNYRATSFFEETLQKFFALFTEISRIFALFRSTVHIVLYKNSMEIFFQSEEYFHAICFSLHLFHSVYVNLQFHDLIKQLSSAETYFFCGSGNIPIGSLQRV